MKKQKLTKKEKLAAYKAEKQAAKLLREKHSLLADYLAENAEVVVSCHDRTYSHDCSLFSLKMRDQEVMEQKVRMLYGDCKFFLYRAGRFTFSIGSFFHYADNTNPYLWGVVPSVVKALCDEGLIKLSLRETREEVPGWAFAMFNIVRL